LASVLDRRRRANAIDAAIEGWSSGLPAAEAEGMLIAAGVPAHAAVESAAAVADAQLNHRHHFPRVTHPLWGEITIENARFALSRTPAEVNTPAPTFGQHTNRVLSELLG